jgi:uncharacterized protein
MKDMPWDHGLRVTAEADGLAGHAGAVLLRKLADQAGLTAALGSALARAGKFPLVDRGLALVSMAVAMVLGATSMNDITLLAPIVSGQDWAGMRALVTEDVTWSFPGDARIPGVAEGADAVIARATVITSSGVQIELQNVLAGVSGAAVSLHVTAHADDGRTLDQHLFIVLSVRDGKVYKMDSYLSVPVKIVLYFGPPT